MDNDIEVIKIEPNNEELLKSMGFTDEEEIMRALQIAKNDINEAVAILTNEKPTKLTSLTSDDNEIIMTEAISNSPSRQNKDANNDTSNNNPLIFPYDCLIQLENSVFIENWSIPYKKDEWLDRLMVSSIALLKEGIADSDQNCKRFLDRVLPEVYRKLIELPPVLKWNAEIQQGVYNMIMLFIDLICVRINQPGVPDILLNTLNLVFDPEKNFQKKNSLKVWDKAFYVDKLDGLNNCFTRDNDRFGWLLNLINHFGLQNGFDGIKIQLENTNDINEFNLLLRPLATCIDFLNQNFIKSQFESSFLRLFEFIKKLEGEDFKDKNVGKVFDLLMTMKQFSANLWPNEFENFHLLHLSVVLNMLRYSHFNSKMNSLKEICKLIENSRSSACKTVIKEDALADWIINQHILSLAVEGNIDQSQYCDKIKTIVEFIGDRINNEEISTLWNMQYNKSMSLVDNLYMIIGIAATKFNAEQLDYLLSQITHTWNDSSFKLHDKLVILLRIIGREAKGYKTYTKILEALWELKNRPGLSRQLLLLIYAEHLNVLNGTRLSRDQAKSLYLKKCCEDLKRAPGSSIAIASLKHMHDILNSYQKSASKALKEVISEIVVPIMKNLCTSLLKCHTNASEKAKLLNEKLDHKTLVDDIFTHEEVVQTHLLSIKFILQEGNLYLNLGRAQEIWNILVNNEDSCDWEKQIGYEWFIDCLLDLNDESRSEIFKKKILTMPTSKLTQKGYECFKLYFLRVNEHEGKVQIRNDLENFVVEKLELTGLDYLWDIILYVDDEKIADLATKLLLEILYEKLNARLRREIVQLHQKFINECYTRLENCIATLDGNTVGQVLFEAFRITCATTSLNDAYSAPVASKEVKLRCIERLLMIAERYIITVEENCSIQRTFLPHFLTFKSETYSLTVNADNRSAIDLFVCSNETLGELRCRISNILNIQPNNIQLYINDKLLSQSNDIKLLANLNIDGTQPLTAKIASSYPSSLNQTPVKDSTGAFNSNFSFSSSSRIDPDLEKSFPGVLISTNESSFEMLTRLEDVEEPKIRTRIRNIIKLIPTNPRLLDSFDSIIGRIVTNSSTTLTSSTASVAAASTTTQPKSINFFKSPSSNATNISQSYNASTSLKTNLQQQFATSISTPSTPTNTQFPALMNTYNTSNEQLSSVPNKGSFAKRNDSTSSLDSRNRDFGKFFDKTQPLHRILYHLEALCSKIMPSSNELTSQQNSELFLQDFLKANGLEVLINLLKLDNGVNIVDIKSNEYETKQDIYILLLQLLRLLLFGSFYPLNPTIQNQTQSNNCVNKRPSNEPITTCAKKTILPSMIGNFGNQSFLNQNHPNISNLTLNHHSSNDPNTHSCQNGIDNDKNIIEKMTVSEMIEIITQLLNILWSAAAGNLQFSFSQNSSIDPNATTVSATTSNKRTISNSSSSSSLVIVNKQQVQSTSNNNILSIHVQPSQSNMSSSACTIIGGGGGSESLCRDLAELNKNRVDDNINIEECLDNIDINNLNKSSGIQKEVKFFIPNHRLSTGSNMSTSSIDSSDTQSQLSQIQLSPSSYSNALHSGICIKQKSITIKDIKIASKAIEMISCFVQYRKDCLTNLLNMKLFNDCVIDVLTGSISTDIRIYMANFLLKLSHIETANLKCKDYLINLIIKARLPLWVNSSLTRSSSQRLISQSSQYFKLRCALLEDMTLDEQSAYSIDLAKMLNDEVNWFTYFSPTKSLKDIDDILLTGHLCLLRSLLTCETANKSDIGEEIINQLIKTYLFPASYIINFPSEDTSMEPICSTDSSRLSAYKLLVELSRNCIKNLRKISEKLILFHHSSNSSLLNEWNVIPLVTSRAECGYVGLKNGGATCYMNAVLQQLFMIPSITNYLLSIEDESEKSSVFWQLQNVFAHLKDSKLEYYVPEPFWKAFRMWGQEVNLREQQDAFDFFISMTDQIDEHLKKINREPIFKKVFEGTFSNQFICKDCPHRYEREEAFLGLNLPVKSGSLQESLSQFVKDELLDGDNSYYCEKCNEKRSSIKRTCIKKLPKYLCIQLKRFDYDWESNRSIKFDDYFQFPRQLNVSPYMYDTINKETNEEQANKKTSNESNNQNEKEIEYELVGIVVHSGQANAGHYYSFIKGPKNNTLSIDQEIYELEQMNQSIDENNFDTNSSGSNLIRSQSTNNNNNYNNNNNEEDEKWYKYNDTSVEEIYFNDQTLVEECFGGTFTATGDYNKMLPEERVRFWNGYMLFYKEPDQNINSQRKLNGEVNKFRQSKDILNSHAYKITKDSFSELAELVTKGDEKGLFCTGLPPAIEQIVKSENLEFCKNRAIYDLDYFKFMFNMVRIFKTNSLCGDNKIVENDLFTSECCNLGLEFLYNTYFKTGKKLRGDLSQWIDMFKDLLLNSKEGGNTMLSFIVKHEQNSSFIRHFLLECPIVEIRETCGALFEYCLSSLVTKFDIQPLNNPKITSLITSLVQLLDKAVVDLCKNAQEYFKLLYAYANMTKDTCQQLISLGIFSKLLCFLLGNPGTLKSEESTNRRWSSIQTREFSIVHELIASLVLMCNVLSLKTCDLPTSEQLDRSVELIDASSAADIIEQYATSSDTTLDFQPKSDNFKFVPPVASNDLLPMPQEMQIYLVGALSNRYLKELVYAFEQINHSSLTKTLEMILSCCYCNELFSSNMIHQILLHINNSSSNEIKQALSLLYNIILIEDQLQLTRFRLAIDGYRDSNTFFNGLLSIIRQNQSSDAKKSYQCVKFIVTLANKCQTCKDYLLKTASNWEWSVNWLKTKMSDSASSSSTISSGYNVTWGSTKFQSNEDTEIRTFQRTKSAQRTLDDATALLKSTEFDI